MRRQEHIDAIIGKAAEIARFFLFGVSRNLQIVVNILRLPWLCEKAAGNSKICGPWAKTLTLEVLGHRIYGQF